MGEVENTPFFRVLLRDFRDSCTWILHDIFVYLIRDVYLKKVSTPPCEINFLLFPVDLAVQREKNVPEIFGNERFHLIVSLHHET